MWSDRAKTETCLLRGRLSLLAFITCDLLFLTILYIYKEVNLQSDRRAKFLDRAYNAYAWCFLAMFILLASAVAILVWRLRAKTRYL